MVEVDVVYETVILKYLAVQLKLFVEKVLSIHHKIGYWFIYYKSPRFAFRLFRHFSRIFVKERTLFLLESLFFFSFEVKTYLSLSSRLITPNWVKWAPFNMTPPCFSPKAKMFFGLTVKKGFFFYMEFWNRAILPPLFFRKNRERWGGAFYSISCDVRYGSFKV